MNNTALIYDITFYQVDEDGNDLLDDKGNTKVFRIKDGLRFKPLEYLCDDIDIDILEEVKWIVKKVLLVFVYNMIKGILKFFTVMIILY